MIANPTGKVPGAVLDFEWRDDSGDFGCFVETFAGVRGKSELADVVQADAGYVRRSALRNGGQAV